MGFLDNYIDTSSFIVDTIPFDKDPWYIIARLPYFIRLFLNKRSTDSTKVIVAPGAFVNYDQVYLGEGTYVEPGAYIKGPAIIGRNVIVRHGAYIRDHVCIGDNCIVGHSTEIKQSIMFNNANAPHRNFIGNSIVGNKVNLAVGTSCSNVKNLSGQVLLQVGGERIPTGSKYFGSIIGDGSKLGSHVVLSPGTIIGKNVVTYPCLHLRGYIASNSLVKPQGITDLIID